MVVQWFGSASLYQETSKLVLCSYIDECEYQRTEFMLSMHCHDSEICYNHCEILHGNNMHAPLWPSLAGHQTARQCNRVVLNLVPIQATSQSTCPGDTQGETPSCNHDGASHGHEHIHASHGHDHTIDSEAMEVDTSAQGDATRYVSILPYGNPSSFCCYSCVFLG